MLRLAATPPQAPHAAAAMTSAQFWANSADPNHCSRCRRIFVLKTRQCTCSCSARLPQPGSREAGVAANSDSPGLFPIFMQQLSIKLVKQSWDKRQGFGSLYAILHRRTAVGNKKTISPNFLMGRKSDPLAGPLRDEFPISCTLLSKGGGL